MNILNFKFGFAQTDSYFFFTFSRKPKVELYMNCFLKKMKERWPRWLLSLVKTLIFVINYFVLHQPCENSIMMFVHCK